MPVPGPVQGWLWVEEELERHIFGWLDGEEAVAGSQGCRRVGRGREGGGDGTPGGGKGRRVGLSERTRDGQVVQGMKKGPTTVLDQQ